MPLTEFLRMSKGKVDGIQERPSTSSDLSSRREIDCVELVWENGQIMMQGQSGNARKNTISNNFQALGSKPQDGINANCSKTTKFSTTDPVLANISLPVPLCEMELDQDVDFVPWLSYPIEDPLHNDYTFDFLHELSGITINDLSTENNLAHRERKCSFHGNDHDNSTSFKHGNTSKASSTTEKNTRGGSSEVPHFTLPFQHNVSKSSISDMTSNNAGISHHIASQDAMHNPSLSAFTSLRLQKLDAGQPSSSSGFTNFPYFSRPSALARANHVTVNASKGLENDDRRCTLSITNPPDSTRVNLGSGCSRKEIVPHDEPVTAPVETNSESLPTKLTEELLSANRPVCREDIVKNDMWQNHAYDEAMSIVGMNAERNLEPVIAASSASSGNSAERASNEPARDLKRKSRESAESEGPSEEVEDESEGAKKKVLGRTGSKRSRAAEVHNLSERRRRDKINEKMRALQELIPNCNKVDKASMLDEAIEYLKTLQLQVQMLSMSAGLYMQPMMLPPGMQPVHGANMPHFSFMGPVMGMGMAFGMNVLDMNSGMKMVPFQGPYYPMPGTGPTFYGMPGSTLQAFGHPGQGLTMPMQQAPVVQMSGNPPSKMPMGLDVSGVAGSTNAPHLAPFSSRKDSGPQVIPNNNVNGSMNEATNQKRCSYGIRQWQASNKGIDKSTSSHDQSQAVNASETARATSEPDTMHR